MGACATAKRHPMSCRTRSFATSRILGKLLPFLRRRASSCGASLAISSWTSDAERRRGRQAAIDDAAVAEIADPAPSPEHQLAARQEYRILVRALGELTANQRAALVMNRVDQMTHAEIARQLGVSPSMVNKYIMRALTHCVMRLMEAGR